MDALLRVVDLQKSFGDTPVLKGISFDLPKGTVLSIIGASGSGKSTLLRCVNLLEIPSAGEIHFRGAPVEFRKSHDGSLRLPAAAAANTLRRRIGMVFQQFNLWPHMTVEGNVMEAPRRVAGLTKAEARDKARAYLDKVGLLLFAGRYPARLSGGQQQRVAIARALAMEPDILLFDEATSSLDPELTGEVLKVMRTLAAEGTTMIVVTHEMAFARDVSDRILFLHDGAIEEDGPPARVFAQPQSERCRRFLTEFVR
ncbi:MAG TPA: amino acid ABC transporter ATP-binding protein [Alphaproteobacteria bacterium]